MDRSLELINELGALRRELGELREDMLTPMIELNKNLHRLAEAAWVMVQMAKKEKENGRDRKE